MRRVILVWDDQTWAVAGEDVLPDLDLPDANVSEDGEPSFYWDVVDRSGEVVYSRSDDDPRIGFYDHVTKDGQLEGGVAAQDFAVIDVLVPDVPGAELRLHAVAPPALADVAEAVTRALPDVSLTHVLGAPRG